MAKNRNKKKKIFLKIFGICLIILIILIACLNIASKTKTEEQKVQEYEESIKDFQEFREEFEAETILPRKIYELYKYDGKNENEVVFRSMHVFSQYIDYLQTNVKLEDSEAFYKKNIDEIKEKTGIETFEEFEIFMKELQKYNLNVEDFKYAEIVVGSSYFKKDYFVFDINFYYGENPDKVTFTISFANKVSEEIKVKYAFKAEDIASDTENKTNDVVNDTTNEIINEVSNEVIG